MDWVTDLEYVLHMATGAGEDVVAVAPIESEGQAWRGLWDSTLKLCRVSQSRCDVFGQCEVTQGGGVCSWRGVGRDSCGGVLSCNRLELV